MPPKIATLFDPQPIGSMYADAGEISRWLKPLEPVYLFNSASLRRSARSFQGGFPGTVSYAVKANPEERVIDALVGWGLSHFDVASIGEIESIATRHPDVTLHFNNPVKAQDAIETAFHRFGVRSYALDEPAEFSKIVKATGGDRDVVYSVRFKMAHRDASYDFGSKFGTTADKAVGLLRDIEAFGARPALTFHPGSQCTDPQMYAQYLETAADIVARSGVEIEQINVGGGFPVRYQNAPVPELNSYFEVIDRALDASFPSRPRLMCEPGRAMVAPAVSLLARIIHVREDSHAVFLNDGVYGGMQEQSLVDLSMPVKVWRDGRLLQGPSEHYHVFGPTCDPVDRLAKEIELPAHLCDGDYIEFGLLGAYGSATSTGFNGFRSASYLDVLNGFEDC